MRQTRKQMMMRRRRIAKAIFAILLILLVVWLITSCRSSNKATAEDTGKYIEYIVQNGDTLWGIAKEYSNDSIDIRIVIRDIANANQIDNALIHSGDVLLIPTKYSGE